MKYRFACAGLCVVLLGATGPLPLTTSLERRVDTVVNAALARQYVPGAQVAIVERGRIVYTKGYGYRNWDDRVPTNSQTAFAIGSVSKQFAAASIVLLQEEGKLNVEDSLAKYLPDAPHAGEETLYNLLTHTSGIIGYTELPNFDDMVPVPTTPEAIVASIAKEPLAFKPGTKWEYSNTNYVLLGMVVAKVSGEPYAQFLRDRIFTPLGMTRAWFTRSERVYSNTARGYSEFMLGLPIEHAWPADASWWDAAGGLTMSAGDLARWDIALDGGKVVTPDDFTRMSTSAILADGKPTNYGFGLGIGSTYGHRAIVHDGLVSGFRAENLTFPQDRAAIVLLTNGDNFAIYPVVNQIAAILYGVKVAPKPLKSRAYNAAVFAEAKQWLEYFLHGTPDTSKMTADLLRDLPPYRIAELGETGKMLGEPKNVQPLGVDVRPPLTIYTYRVTFAKALANFTFTLNDRGQVAGFALEAAN